MPDASMRAKLLTVNWRKESDWTSIQRPTQGRAVIHSMRLTAHQAKYIAHGLTLQHRGGGIDRLSQALFNASVDLIPHQIEAAVFALHSPLSKGVLLADEVGLDKAWAQLNLLGLPLSTPFRVIRSSLIGM